jgi:Tfp pilus assembly protein PilF
MRSTPLVTSLFTSSGFRAVSRWVLGTAGILWVALAASLCGCSPIAPVNGWAMNQRGKSLYRRGDYAKARSEFERALMDSPYSADYAFNVAAAMDQQGDHLAAEKMYRHALTLDPAHQPAYHGMAAMMLEDGRTTEATDLVNTWAATQPYSEEAAIELGWVKAEQGDYVGAESELRRALRENPRNTRALAQLARVHSKSGRTGDAAADYARSLFMDPHQPEAQSELAALGQGAYGDPALQMATAMPIYDPQLQAAAYPAFTAPQSQTQLAGSPTSDPGWPGSPAGMQATFAPMGDSQYPALGMTSPQLTGQAHWSQPQMQSQQPMQTMNGQPTYPTSVYPEAVSGPYSTPQFYNASRPTTSFFQPQHSFPGSVPGSFQGEMLTSTPMPTPVDMNVQEQSPSHNAPTWNSGQPTPMPLLVPGNNWNTPPAMNASFGNTLPTEQISSVPVVPAF